MDDDELIAVGPPARDLHAALCAAPPRCPAGSGRAGDSVGQAILGREETA